MSTRGTPPALRRPALRRLAVLVALVGALVVTTSGVATGVSTNVTVQANVVSASSITNLCEAAPATQLGLVAPGTGTTTSTAAGTACRIDFGSTSNSSQLRINQADGAGKAMTQGLLPATVQSQFGAPGRMFGVFAYNSLLAYFVGRGGVVRRTTSGGASMAEYSLTGTPVVNDVEAVPGDPNTWWLVGANKTLRQTTNGQVATPTFTDQSAVLTGWPAGVAITGISMPDASTIYLVGASRWMAVFSSGTWKVFQNANVALGNFTSVDATTAGTAMAVDDLGNVVTTTTGGANSAAWSAANISSMPLLHVAMGSTSRAYAVGERGVAYSWDGTSWTNRTAAVGALGDLTGVENSPTAPDTAWAIDEAGAVFTTINNGVSWAASGDNLADYSAGISAGTSSVLYTVASGRDASVSTDSGATFSPAYNIPNGQQLSAVAASRINGKVAAAVGSFGVAKHTTDGATWNTSTTPSTKAMFGVSMGEDTHGIAVGEGGFVWTTADGAATWQQVATPVTARLNDVTMADQYSAIAVGYGGTIMMTQNAGANWTVNTSGTTKALAAVTQFGTHLITVGAQGAVLWSSDSGNTWTLVAAGTLPDPTAQLVGVALVSDTTAYAATSFDKVWKTTDAGATWVATAGGTGIPNRALDAVNSTIAIATTGDRVEVSQDGGATFSLMTGATGLNMRDVDVVDTHTALVSGQDALVERFDPSAAANAVVNDYSFGSNDWTVGNFFGVCVQSITGGATGDWTADITGTPGLCEPNTGDPWQGVPNVSTKVAHNPVAGTSTVKFVWAFKPSLSQTPGSYEATMVFEALAPDV